MANNNDPAAKAAAEKEKAEKAAAEKAKKEQANKEAAQKAEAEKAAAAEKAAKVKEAALEKKYRPIVEEYAPHYPHSKAFHFCSDSQIFLEGDIAEAQAHQNQVDPQKEVVTVNV